MIHKDYKIELRHALRDIEVKVDKRWSNMHEYAIMKVYLEHPQTIDLLLQELYDLGYWVDSKFIGSNTYMFRIQWENE